MPHKEGIAVCGCVAGVLALEGSVGVGSDCGGDVLCEGFWSVELILVFIWMVSRGQEVLETYMGAGDEVGVVPVFVDRIRNPACARCDEHEVGDGVCWILGRHADGADGAVVANLGAAVFGGVSAGGGRKGSHGQRGQQEEGLGDHHVDVCSEFTSR